jgi:hypothetical protein
MKMNSLAFDKKSATIVSPNGLSVARDYSGQIILFVFVATFFYSKSVEYRAFRVIYSVFLYLSLWKLFLFYNGTPKFDLKVPPFYRVYLVILFVFVAYNFIIDLRNPAFDIQTQINNPYGFLAVLNVLAFGLGASTKNLDTFYKISLCVSVCFVVLCFVPDLPKFEGFHGYICAYAIIPVLILSRHYRRYQLFSIVLIALAFMFSIKTDYRIIVLRILMFLSLYGTLLFCKKYSVFKAIVLLAACISTFEIIYNMSSILNFFGSFVNVRSFETDTRSFLYQELFNDLNSSELITGRGFSGTYFSLFFLNTWNEFGVSFQRFTIEVGFLQLILKGGYIYYVLFVLPLLLTSLKGIFSGKSSGVSYAICIFIFSELLLMFFENIPNYGFNFFSIFFLAGYVFQRIKEE